MGLLKDLEALVAKYKAQEVSGFTPRQQRLFDALPREGFSYSGEGRPLMNRSTFYRLVARATVLGLVKRTPDAPQGFFDKVACEADRHTTLEELPPLVCDRCKCDPHPYKVPPIYLMETGENLCSKCTDELLKKEV